MTRTLHCRKVVLARLPTWQRLFRRMIRWQHLWGPRYTTTTSRNKVQMSGSLPTSMSYMRCSWWWNRNESIHVWKTSIDSSKYSSMIYNQYVLYSDLQSISNHSCYWLKYRPLGQKKSPTDGPYKKNTLKLPRFFFKRVALNSGPGQMYSAIRSISKFNLVAREYEKSCPKFRNPKKTCIKRL